MGTVARELSPAFLEFTHRTRGIVTVGVSGASNLNGSQASKAAFSRSSRLLRHADFERVYKLGKRHFSASMTVFYLRRQEALQKNAASLPGGLRVGFTVGRALGGAVQRNRMKRRLREAVRLARPFPGPNADVVINPKNALSTTPFESLLNEARNAFVVISRKLAGDASGAAPTQGKAAHHQPQA